MRFLIPVLILVAAIAQNSPTQRIDQNKKRQAQTKNAEKSTEPIQSQPTVIPAQISQPTPNNRQNESAEKPCYLKRIMAPDVLPNWILMIAGVVGIFFAFRTLGIIGKQAEDGTKAAIAAEKSADAAFLNAQAVIDAERAWIMVNLEEVPGFTNVDTWQDGVAASYTDVRFRLKYVNEGKSIAWVEEIRALFQIVQNLPPKPDLSILELLTVDLEWVGSKGSRYFDSALRTDRQASMELRSILWGAVKYRDAFGEHQTVFGFRIQPDGRFQRLPSQYHAYNQNT